MRKNKPIPPKLFLRFFRWFCHPKLLKHIEGDLMELHSERVKEFGKRKADRKFIVDVLLLFRLGIIGPAKEYRHVDNYAMYKSYFKIGWRNLLSNKGYSMINVSGLVLGITCSIVLFLIVDHGRNYDKFHTKGDRIYRVITKSKSNDGYSITQGIPPLLPNAIQEDFASVEEVAFTSYRRGSLITIPDGDKPRKYEEAKGVAFSEPSFIRIFDRNIVIGSTDKGLDDANEAVISQRWALKYFGKADAIGEWVEYEGDPYKITAVMEDFPTNTDLPFDLILSYATIKKAAEQRGWGDLSDTDNCYFLLREGSSIASIEEQMPTFAKKYTGDNGELETTFIMQPLFSIHADMRVGNYNTKLPMAAQIAFTVIGFFLLITACINFINLTTAEAIKRTREVGVRKVLGSSRKQLIYQFVTEAFIITIFAIFISLGAVQLALGFINPFLDTSLALNLLSSINLWMLLIILTVVVTILSGFYPAWLVSGIKPVLALKNQMSNRSSSGFTLRKGLVVFQFFISQFFIIGTIVLARQMDFMQDQDLGFSTDAIISVAIPYSKDDHELSSRKKRTLKNEILRLKGVENASLAYAPPSFNAVVGSRFSMVDSIDNFDTQIKQVDGDYIDLYQFDLIAGELLPDLDSMTSVVVNEKLLKTAGFSDSQEIIGKQISLWGRNLTVRGVVKDFNTQSLSHQIEPVVLVNNVSGYQSVSVKLVTSKMQETIDQVKTIWEAQFPEYIFKYTFIDDQVRDLYKGERKLSTLVSVVAFMAIFIGCLGLLGLVMFMTNQRTKEIGVRKILGASAESVVLLLSKEFAKLILLGFAFAAPLAGLLMHKILEEFAYKTDLGPSVFLMSLLSTCMIAFVTVAYRSFIAATANPIESLRSE